MIRLELTRLLPRLIDIRRGEAARAGILIALFFFLIAANNMIKVVRDSLFLSRFPITQLPYVYLLVALLASLIIAIYTRYTSRVPLYKLILASNAFIISNIIVFWFLITFFDFGWILYAFYVWSAIVGAVAVAQFWGIANETFTSREAKRLFGIVAAGGTLGGILGGFGAKWAVDFFLETNQLLWAIAALFAGAFGVVCLANRERRRGQSSADRRVSQLRDASAQEARGALGLIRESHYLQMIAGLIFVSVIVSTLIDFQFKAAAKEAYPSRDVLTGFFGSFYAWLNIITLFAQLVLSGKLLSILGLTPSFFLLPMALSVGSLGILVWPGLFAVTGTRLADGALRTGVNRSGMEILYLPVPAAVKKKVKTFIDVVVERLGDATAGFIVLFYTLFLMGSDLSTLSYFSIAVILVWIVLICVLRGGYLEALRRGLESRDISLEGEEIDYADKGTIEAILQILQSDAEQTVLFGLDLVEKLNPGVIVPRLPRTLLGHSSPTVRSRALRLFVSHPDPAILREMTRLLEDENKQVQAEAVNAVCAIRKEDAIPVMSPYLESSDPRVQRSAIECMLHYGDPEIREVALTTFRKMVSNRAPEGEKGRVEAARLMGEFDDPEFPGHLSRLIGEDLSIPVIREAMAAAGKRKYPSLVGDLLLRLC
ncbi:MAG: Npt1/Npt2 family nucleotide transporter [Candidatus Binatia bacterium]